MGSEYARDTAAPPSPLLGPPQPLTRPCPTQVELQPIVVVESNAAKFTYEQLGFIGGGGGVPSGLLPAKK
jgi:hypothetical protein